MPCVIGTLATRVSEEVAALADAGQGGRRARSASGRSGASNSSRPRVLMSGAGGGRAAHPVAAGGGGARRVGGGRSGRGRRPCSGARRKCWCAARRHRAEEAERRSGSKGVATPPLRPRAPRRARRRELCFRRARRSSPAPSFGGATRRVPRPRRVRLEAEQCGRASAARRPALARLAVQRRDRAQLRRAIVHLSGRDRGFEGAFPSAAALGERGEAAGVGFERTMATRVTPPTLRASECGEPRRCASGVPRASNPAGRRRSLRNSPCRHSSGVMATDIRPLPRRI